MFAKIKGNSTVYGSVIFAVIYKGLKSKAILFDETYSQLIVLDFFDNNHRPRILFMDGDHSSWSINQENFKSYWNIKDIFKVVDNNKYNNKMLEEAKLIQSNSISSDFNDIKTQYDIEALELCSFNFHDSYILKMETNMDTFKILLDSSWGTCIYIEGVDVIQNDLNSTNFFDDCQVSVEDGNVVFKFYDFESEQIVLKAKSIRWKALFDEKYNIKMDNIKLDNDKMTFFYGKDEIVVHLGNINDSLFNFNKDNTIGFLAFIEDYSATFKLIDNNTMRSICITKGSLEKWEEYKDRVLSFKEIVENNIYNVIVLEDEEYNGYGGIDNGETLFQEEYSKIYSFLYFYKYTGISIVGNLLFWLIIQLCNPALKWGMFYLFGVGISLFTFILSFIVFLKDLHNDVVSLVISDKKIIFHAINSFIIDYNDVVSVEKGKRIIIKTKKKKYKLINSYKNEEIYNILIEHINKEY